MSTVAAPILLTVLMAFVVLGLVSLGHTQTSLAVATGQAAAAAGDRMRTQIEIRAATVSGANLTLDVYNAGTIAVADFSQIDLIVDYVGLVAVGPPPIIEHVVARLSYVTGVPLADQWRVTAIQPDGMHPGIWNPGETLTITATLPREAQADAPGTAVLGTPNGVAASRYFTATG